MLIPHRAEILDGAKLRMSDSIMMKLVWYAIVVALPHMGLVLVEDIEALNLSLIHI